MSNPSSIRASGLATEDLTLVDISGGAAAAAAAPVEPRAAVSQELGTTEANSQKLVQYTKVGTITPTSRRINLVLRVVRIEPRVQCGGTSGVPLLELSEVSAGDETGTVTLLLTRNQTFMCGGVGDTIVVRNAQVFMLENILFLEVDEHWGHVAKAPAQALFKANTLFDLSRVNFHLLHTI